MSKQKQLNFHVCTYSTGNSMNNLLKYCGLVDARMNASKKDSPVCTSFIFSNKQKDMKFDRLLPKSGILKFFRNIIFLTSNF